MEKSEKIMENHEKTETISRGDVDIEHLFDRKCMNIVKTVHNFKGE